MTKQLPDVMISMTKQLPTCCHVPVFRKDAVTWCHELRNQDDVLLGLPSFAVLFRNLPIIVKPKFYEYYHIIHLKKFRQHRNQLDFIYRYIYVHWYNTDINHKQINLHRLLSLMTFKCFKKVKNCNVYITRQQSHFVTWQSVRLMNFHNNNESETRQSRTFIKLVGQQQENISAEPPAGIQGNSQNRN